MEFDLGVDPVWFRAKMKDQRLREAADADYVATREQQRRGKNFDEIEQMMRDDGEIPSEPPSEPDSAPLPVTRKKVRKPKPLAKLIL